MEHQKSWLKEEAVSQNLFISRITRHFAGRRRELKKLQDFCEKNTESQLIIVTGKPGIGKSALLAKFIEPIKQNHPDWLIISHFVGASPHSTNLKQLLERFCRLLNPLTGLLGKIPDDPENLVMLFQELLKEVSQKRKVIIIIDAVNLLEQDDHPHSMNWLPQQLGKDIKCVISTLPGETWDAMINRHQKPVRLYVSSLNKTDRVKFVNNHFHATGKEFTNQEDKKTFYDKIETGHPLYISIALEELHLIDDAEKLSEKINRLPDNIPDLFAQVLERAEVDFNTAIVKDFMSFIACGKDGMTREELQTLLKDHAPSDETEKLPDTLWTQLYESFNGYLFQRSGVIDFFYKQLKEAVLTRYLTDKKIKKRYHQSIADYFGSRWKEPYPRALNELSDQMVLAGKYRSFRQLLLTFDFLQLKLQYCGPSSIQRDLASAIALANEQDLASFSILKELVTLSYHTLREDFRQFPSQLIGRTPPDPPYPLNKLKKRALQFTDFPWLCPVTKCLTPVGGPLRTVLKGHSHHVTNVALVPDGSKTVSVSSDRTLRVWDNRLGNELQKINLTGYVDEIHLTKDGQTVFYQEDHELKKLDLRTGVSTYLLSLGQNHWDRVEITPDGRHCTYIKNKNILQYIDFRNGKKTKYDCQKKVSSFTVSEDGQYVYLSSDTDNIFFYNHSQGQLEFPSTMPTQKTEFYALVPNGKEYILLDADEKLKRRDIQTQEVLKIYDGEVDNLHALICSSGDMVVAETGDSLRVWRRSSGEFLGTLRDPQLQLPFYENMLKTFACFGFRQSPDKSSIISYSRDGISRRWDVNRYRLVNYDEVTSIGSRVYIFPDSENKMVMQVGFIIGRLLPFMECFYFHIRFWDIKRNKLQRDIYFQCYGNDTLFSLSASVKQGRIVFTHQNREIHVLDLDPVFSYRKLKGHTRTLPKVRMTSDGHMAVSYSTDTTLMVWNLDRQSHEDLDSFKIRTEEAVALDRAGKRLLVSDRKHCLQVWDLLSLKQINLLEGHNKKVNGIDISPNGKMAVSGSDDKTIILWDISHGKPLNTLHGHEDAIRDVTFVANGERIVSVGKDNFVRVWETATGDCLLTLNYPDKEGVYYHSWDISADGNVIVREKTGSEGDCLIVSSLLTGQEITSLKGYFFGEIYAMGGGEAFFTSGAFTTSGDGSLVAYTPGYFTEVWNVKAGFKIATLMEHQESLRSMKFTPDNRRLVTGSKDSTVRVWDVARQSELYRLEGHTDDVDALAVAENGLRAVTGSRDRTIRLWDIQKGYCLATFTADSIAGQLALSGDGRTIVFRSEGQVHCLKLMGDKKQ